MDHKDIIRRGKEIIRIEAGAVADLESRMDESFAEAVRLLYECKGRVIITGVGKSGIIARKIVATFNSTGTPAMFLHPSDAVHGDLGMVRNDDVIVCLSKSGDTPELLHLFPMFKRLGVPIVSLVGKVQSAVARESTVVLNASVREEACPLDLAPTSSTTATMVLGDALAIALLQEREFSKEDFARFHPGGILGRRLLLRVDEIMASGDAVPKVMANVTLREAIMEMTTKRLGCTCVVDAQGKLEGFITDGDLRRLLQTTADVTNTSVGMIMNRKPKIISKGALAVIALQEMEFHNITQIIVVDHERIVVGVIHLHDLVKLGIGGEENG